MFFLKTSQYNRNTAGKKNKNSTELNSIVVKNNYILVILEEIIPLNVEKHFKIIGKGVPRLRVNPKN